MAEKSKSRTRRAAREDDLDRELEQELEQMEAEMDEPRSRRRHYNRRGNNNGVTLEGVLTTIATVGIAVMTALIIYRAYSKPKI